MPKSSAILTRLSAGQSPRQIADELRVSLRRVYQVRGEKKREPIDAVKSTAIRAAVSAGRSQREVAAEFGCSRKTVAALCADLDLAPVVAAKPLPRETIDHILARSKAGRSPGTIARELGVAVESVRSVIRRHPAPKLREGDEIMRAIVAEMERRGLTAHGLAQLIEPPPTRETLYEYMRGDSSPTTPTASRILVALNLVVRK